MSPIRWLLDRLPGVDFVLAQPETLLMSACAGALLGLVLVIVL